MDAHGVGCTGESDRKMEQWRGAGRAQRFTVVIHGTSNQILRFLQRQVGSADADDLLGETLLAAWRRVEDLPEDAVEARMWLFGIARGTLMNHARSERRRLALIDKLRMHARSTEDAPAADFGDEVRDAIARLSPDHAEIIRCVHWGGLTLAEAAQHIGISSATARARHSRAKKCLRSALATSGVDHEK